MFGLLQYKSIMVKGPGIGRLLTSQWAGSITGEKQQSRETQGLYTALWAMLTLPTQTHSGVCFTDFLGGPQCNQVDTMKFTQYN